MGPAVFADLRYWWKAVGREEFGEFLLKRLHLGDPSNLTSKAAGQFVKRNAFPQESVRGIELPENSPSGRALHTGMKGPITMEFEVGILAFDAVPFNKLSDPGQHIDGLDLGRDALIEFVRQLSDYFWR